MAEASSLSKMNKSRLSFYQSDYDTAAEDSDIDSSIYFEACDTSVNQTLENKENSLKGRNSTSTGANRLFLNTKTPLLRKVLQNQLTPRNQFKKRESARSIENPSKIPTLTENMAKLEPEKDEHGAKINLNEKVSEIILEQESENAMDIGVVNELVELDQSTLHTTIIENRLIECVEIIDDNVAKMPLEISAKADAVIEETAEVAPMVTNKDQLPKQDVKNVNMVGKNRVSLAVTKAKQTIKLKTYKRRSSTYEPRKFDSRKSIVTLKKVVIKANKCSSAEVAKETSKEDTEVTTAIETNQAETIASSDATENTSKLRMRKTLAPRLSIFSSRQSTSTAASAVRAQRRQTKNFITAVNVATTIVPACKGKAPLPMSTATATNAMAPPAAPKESNSKSQQINNLINNPTMALSIPITTSLKCTQCMRGFTNENQLKIHTNNFHKLSKKLQGTSNSSSVSGFKCNYCDKNFEKENALFLHLEQNCEKIPATHRKRMYQNEGRNLLNKQMANGNRIFQVQKYSVKNSLNSNLRLTRFLTEKTDGNEAAPSSIASIGMVTTTNIDRNDTDESRIYFQKLAIGHSGISRTPSKAIRCHICSKTFMNCVEYAEHSTNHHI